MYALVLVQLEQIIGRISTLSIHKNSYVLATHGRHQVHIVTYLEARHRIWIANWVY
jgi:hypothetical protein